MASSTVGTHNRRRSLLDTPVDLSKLRVALRCLTALKEELEGIEGTENEIESIITHVDTLQEILGSAKKPTVSFSTMTKEDLNKLGIVRKRLVFRPGELATLVTDMTPKANEEIGLLRDRLLELYARVNMDYEPGSRMILDAVLLTLARIVHDPQSKSDVAIFPEMRIASGDGIQIKNAVSGYETSLTGIVDYGVIQYKDELDNKERLLGVGGVRDDIFKISKGCIFLVEAKRQPSDDGSMLGSYMPEAVGQAIAWAKVTGQMEVRFCLSNGQTWIFCILKLEDDQWTYYESATRQLSREALQFSSAPLSGIVPLVLEWLAPSATQLYELCE